MLIDFAKQIWNDDTLYGHLFTAAPSNLWKFSKADANYFVPEINDPDVTCIGKTLFRYTFEKITRLSNGSISSIEKIEKTRYFILEFSELIFRRIGGFCLTATACATIAPLGFAIKIIQTLPQIYQIFAKKQPPTLTLEFQVATREALEKMIGYPDLDYENADSIKICLNAIHDGQQVSKSYVFPSINSHLSREQIKDQISLKFNALFINLQQDVVFNQSEETKWRFGLWLRKINHSGKPVFSLNVNGASTLNGNVMKLHDKGFYQQGMLRSGKTLAFGMFEREFCEKCMEMPYTPQIDDFDNFK